MKVFVLFSLLLAVSISLCAQTILLEKEVHLETRLTEKRQCMPIVNKSNGKVGMFLLDVFDITGFLLDKDYQIESKIECMRPKSKFKEIIGTTADKNNFNLFFANKSKSKFQITQFNFNTRETKEIPLELPLKYADYLKSTTVNNKLYVLTLVKESSILNLIEFTGTEVSRKKSFDLRKYHFGNGYKTDLYNNLTAGGVVQLARLDAEIPNPIEYTCGGNKLYYSSNKLVITLDNDPSSTKLIDVSLKDFSCNVKVIEHDKYFKDDPYYIKANSYYYNDVLYQIKASSKQLFASAYDLKGDSALNFFRVTADKEIAFKNTPIIQQGSQFVVDMERELKKTSQLLRKLSANEVGISAYAVNDNIQITIGGYIIVHNSTVGANGQMTSVPRIALNNRTQYGAGGTFDPSLLPAVRLYYGVDNYDYYNANKTVFFQSKVDGSTYKHIPGHLKDNAFDKMKKDIFNNNEFSRAASIFKIDDYYVYGSYNTQTKTYTLKKYTD
ncbi:hypothetical protein E9993_18995 [Labilibacter sediminis]|nr:hypothetical protein E9993_18995 [Labilibacter sediminis]